MSPVNPTTTHRIKAFYTGPFGRHSMLFHGGPEGTLDDLEGAVAEIVDKMIVVQYDGTVWDRVEHAAAGSNLFFPSDTWTPQTSASTIDPGATSSPSTFLQWGGRSPTSGVRAKWYLFETIGTQDQNMRVNDGESAPLDAVTDEFTSQSSFVGAIDGTAVTMYTYINIGQNDYLTHKARRS